MPPGAAEGRTTGHAGLGAHRALIAILLADPAALRREFALGRPDRSPDDHESAWAAACGAQQRLRRGSPAQARREVRALVQLVGDLVEQPWWSDPALSAPAVTECITGCALGPDGLTSAAAQQAWRDAVAARQERAGSGQPGIVASLNARRSAIRLARLEKAWRQAWADWARATAKAQD